MARRSRSRPSRSSLALRWLAVGALVLVGLLYVRPVRAYLERSDSVAARKAQVDVLAARRIELRRQLRYAASDEALAQEARGIGLVRPGERLFIVKGIPRRTAGGDRATIAAGER